MLSEGLPVSRLEHTAKEHLVHGPSLDAPGVSGETTRYQIVVAGSKGGVGKTTIATNLAVVLAESGEQVTYMDCDVAQPNGHLLLHPSIEAREPVTVPVPVVDEEACTLCGKCSEICRFGAILCLDDGVMVFPDLCSGCGGCRLVCPADAIREKALEVGVVEAGRAGSVRFVQGRLHASRAISSVLVREVKRRPSRPGVHIVDSPAGVSCATIQAIVGADYVVVVAEPTVFGLSDLRLSLDMVRILRVPFGVVINRADERPPEVRRYCETEGVEVLLVIENDRRVTETCARGLIAAWQIERYAGYMLELFRKADRRLVQ